jgi:signal transduction histidine kinase
MAGAEEDEREVRRRDVTTMAAIIVVTFMALLGGYAGSRALAVRLTEAYALNIAAEFTRSLADALTPFDSAGRFVGLGGERGEAVYRFARDVAHIDRVAAVGLDRIVAFDSADAKTGMRYDKPYIADALERGRAKVGFADADDADGAYVAEVYMPVRRDGRIVGVFELYLDVSDYVASVERAFALAYVCFAAAVLSAMGAAMWLVNRAMRRKMRDFREMKRLRDAAEDAKRQAERSLEQQRRFTAGAAHELRTPLAVLRARLDGVEASAAHGALPGPEARVALLGDVDRMARLVEQLLAVARLEAGLVEMTDGVDLCAVAREAVARLFPLACAKGKSIELEAPSGTTSGATPGGAAPAVTVRGDAFALEDALCNLIDNALRYSPADGTVTVAVGNDGTVEVRDHGPGVPESLLPHIFEPFVHGLERRGAAGLGLSIVAETAALHGGKVTAANAPQGGAVFRLVLGSARISAVTGS